MPRLCYGSAEQVNLLCSHLNRKVHLSHNKIRSCPSGQLLILYKVCNLRLLNVWKLHTVALLLILALEQHTDKECDNAE